MKRYWTYIVAAFAAAIALLLYIFKTMFVKSRPTHENYPQSPEKLAALEEKKKLEQQLTEEKVYSDNNIRDRFNKDS